MVCAIVWFQIYLFLQPRSLTIVDNTFVILGFFSYFVTTQLSLRNKSRRIYTKILDFFSSKLDQYRIILGLSQFRNHLPYIQFNKNIINFDSSHCLQYCLLSHQTLTISYLYTTFDYPLHLLILSYQAKNVASFNDFTLNRGYCLLSYHRFCSCLLLYKAENVFTINKITDCYSCFCFTSLFSSMSSQIYVGADTS